MSNMNTAIVGSGGREFELGRQLGFSDEVQAVYFLDGNAGAIGRVGFFGNAVS